MPQLEILLDYRTLFCNYGCRPTESQDPNQRSNYISGMKLGNGVKNIFAQAQALDELLKVLPDPELFYVGLKNCETMVSTVRDVNSPEKAVEIVRDVLTTIYSLPKEYQPRVNIFPECGSESERYSSKIEVWLNSIGKTMREIKDENSLHPILDFFARLVSSDGRYGLVKDLPKK